MSNSSLVEYTKISPCQSGLRTHAIDRITPHCVVGQVTVETLGNIFQSASRQASSNYGIGLDGKVGMYVAEDSRSWCSSNEANDQRAVTIECASETTYPYAFKEVVYQKLIDLCVDICRRNKKDTLLWISNKSQALEYQPKKNEMVLTIHRWFANKPCPGDWLYQRLGDLALRVTTRLQEGDEVRYEYLKDIPDNWGNGEPRSIIKKLMDAGIIKGDEKGRIDLSHDMLRLIIMDYRGGAYDRKLGK